MKRSAVQPVLSSDLDLLVRIDRRCFAEGDAYSANEMSYFLNLPETHGFKYVIEGKVVGFILWNGDHIVTLDILEEYRREGFGLNLLRLALNAMVRESLDRCFLEVDRENRGAVQLYEQAGFTVATTFVECGKPRYLMVKQLP